MPNPFNLDLATLDRLAVLLQGIPNSGKTYMGGDMLKYESQYGPVQFINVKGEDGWASTAGMGLGNVGVTVESEADVAQVAADMIRNKVHAAVLDGARPLFNAIIIGILQADKPDQRRLPDSKLDGDRSKSYWSQARFRMEENIKLLKTACKVFLATTVSAQDVHEITGEKQVAPDIYGKTGSGLVGLFDFAGYMTWSIQGPGRIRREVSFQTRSDVQTRQRLAFPIKENIILPDGPGGWALVKAAFQRGLRKEVK